MNHICQSLALENIVSTYKTYNSNLNLAILKIQEKKIQHYDIFEFYGIIEKKTD